MKNVTSVVGQALKDTEHRINLLRNIICELNDEVSERSDELNKLEDKAKELANFLVATQIK